MSKLWVRGVALSIAGLCFTQTGTAAETGFYVGGFYGTSDMDVSKAQFTGFADSIYQSLDYAPDTFANTFDTKAKGYGFFGGYRLFQNLALEGGFMQFGDVKLRERSSGTVTLLTVDGPQDFPTDATLNLDSQISGIAVSALGILPLSYNAEIYARGGALFSTHKLHIYYDDIAGPLVSEPSESDVDLLAGAGISYQLAEVYTVRAEFIRVFDAGDKKQGEGDIDMLTIGVTVRF